MTYIETMLGAIAGILRLAEAPSALSESLVRKQPQTPSAALKSRLLGY